MIVAIAACVVDLANGVASITTVELCHRNLSSESRPSADEFAGDYDSTGLA